VVDFVVVLLFALTGGKQTGTKFHSGSLGEGLRAAIEDVKRDHLQMIEGWNR